MTPLIAAILQKNLPLCFKLLDEGVDLKHKEESTTKNVDKEEIKNFHKEIETQLRLGHKAGSFKYFTTNVFKKTTPMFWAIKCDQVCLVEKLIQSGFNVNWPTESVLGMSALSLAVLNNKVDLIEKLLALSADVHSKDFNSETPLDVAIGASHPNIIKFLMQHGEDPNCKDHQMSPILKAIVTNDDIAIVELLVELGANINLGFINGQQISPLLCAITYYRYNIANYLIHNNAIVTAHDLNGETALHVLTNKNESDNENIVKMKVSTALCLIEKGANVNAKNTKGETPILGACKTLIPELVELLLSFGAEINIRDRNQMLPLTIVLESGFEVKFSSTKKRDEVLTRKPKDEHVLQKQCEIAKLLLRYGADVESKDIGGGTPLHLAVSSSNSKLVELLLKAGANVNCQDFSGLPPLFVAINEKDLKSAQYLVENGADVNMKDYYGKFALVIALERDYDSCKGVKFLVDAGADINATNHQGLTSLHLAALVGNMKAASLLIDAGASLNAKSDNNLAPFHCAILSPFLAKAKIIKKLFEHGFDPNETDEYGLTPYQYITRIQDPELLKTFWYYGYHYSEIDEIKVDSILALNRTRVPKPHVTTTVASAIRVLMIRNELAQKELLKAQKSFLLGIKNNNKQLVLDCLKKGAVARGCSKQLKYPLHYLVERRFYDTLEVLLEEGVPVNVLDRSGSTPLQLAVRRGDLQSCRLLLKYGALYRQLQEEHSEKEQNDEVCKLFQTIHKTFISVKKGDSETLKMIEKCVDDQDWEVYQILMNCVNGKGHTVMAVALDCGQTDILCKLMVLKLSALDLC